MRLIKPSWIQHANEKNNKCPIYSLSVHPDGTRLATGGLDHKVKIWSTLPVLDETADDETNPKLLCTMTTHSGSVLTVRWAHHGRFLASGSDDQVVVIWGLDPEAGGKVWGSNIVNVENWKPVTRLVGHTSDIIDVAWSRDDSMLASVGLDNSIWIWDGYTFDRIHRITQHEGFVKGVTWDPVGNYLATQSDDKSVRIWNTETWKQEQKITAPFRNSPSSTFFRRLSWSPDGAFIAASNAMNGPVFVGAVIEREHWGSDVSFVGHANTIQVAAFNPRLFFLPGDEPSRITASTVLALGSNDFSISIWRNILHKPIVILKEVFGRNLMDLCWSQDGLNLYGCSEDGTICAVQFDAEEFPDRSSAELTDRIIESYEYKSKHQPRRVPKNPPIVQENSFGTSAASSSKVNTIQPKKKKKGDTRRLVSRPATNQAMPRESTGAGSLNSRDAFATPEQNSTSAGPLRLDMLRDAPSRSDFGNGVNQLEARGSKRKAITLGDSGRTMVSTRPRIAPEVRELRAPRLPASGGSGSSSGKMLGSPQIQSVLRAKTKDGSDEYFLQAENAGSGVYNKVTFIEDGADIWLDYLPSAILVMAISENFCAVACEDGNLYVYSHAGRHLFSVKLEAPAFDLSASGKYLFVVTTNCQAQVYNALSGVATCSPHSIAHLVEPDVSAIDIRPNGTPIVITTESSAYAHDVRLQSWVPISVKAQLRQEAESSSSSSRGVSGPLADLEAQCRSASSSGVNGKNIEPEWWEETQRMGLLETRMKASILLGSADEYKHWLVQYATYLAEQEFVGRAEEFLKELIGPIYSHSGKQSRWDSDVIGFKKRDLAVTVSATMSRANQAMSALAGRYQGILQAIKDEEVDL